MRFAYIDFFEKDDFVSGGVLVVDESTKPVEFRTTTDVKIDELQKILYGQALKEVLFKERFAIDLIQSLKEEFDIVLTREKNILSIRKDIEKPVGFLQKYDPFKAVDKFSHKIVNLAEKFEPLLFTISREDEKQLIYFSKALQEIYKTFNIMEPFSRVQKGLEYLYENSK